MDGSRDSAQAVANNGEVSEPVGSVVSAPDDDGIHLSLSAEAVITLRYSDRYQCAWALVSSTSGGTAWIDRSDDGGRSWDGELGKRSPQSLNASTYTAAYRTFDDGQLYSVRACGYGTFTTVDPRRGGASFGETDGPTVCTDWFPIDWTVVDTFTSPDGAELPLRLGKGDYLAQQSGGGFGVRHIKDGHAAGVPDHDLIQQTLDACEPGDYVPGTNITCRFAGVRVAYSDRIDYDTGGGQVVGIVTAFTE